MRTVGGCEDIIKKPDAIAPLILFTAGAITTGVLNSKRYDNHNEKLTIATYTLVGLVVLSAIYALLRVYGDMPSVCEAATNLWNKCKKSTYTDNTLSEIDMTKKNNVGAAGSQHSDTPTRATESPRSPQITILAPPPQIAVNIDPIPDSPRTVSIR